MKTLIAMTMALASIPMGCLELESPDDISDAPSTPLEASEDMEEYCLEYPDDVECRNLCPTGHPLDKKEPQIWCDLTRLECVHEADAPQEACDSYTWCGPCFHCDDLVCIPDAYEIVSN